MSFVIVGQSSYTYFVLFNRYKMQTNDQNHNHEIKINRECDKKNNGYCSAEDNFKKMQNIMSQHFLQELSCNDRTGTSDTASMENILYNTNKTETDTIKHIRSKSNKFNMDLNACRTYMGSNFVTQASCETYKDKNSGQQRANTCSTEKKIGSTVDTSAQDIGKDRILHGSTFLQSNSLLHDFDESAANRIFGVNIARNMLLGLESVESDKKDFEKRLNLNIVNITSHKLLYSDKHKTCGPLQDSTSADSKTLLMTNINLQKDLHNSLRNIKGILNRLKANQKYVKQNFIPYYQTKNYKSLFLDCTEKKTEVKTYFECIKRDFEGLNPDNVHDLYDLEDDFWKRLACKTNMSVYKCYNLWINKENDTEREEILFDLDRKKKHDWIELARYYKKSPLELFRTYKASTMFKKRSKWSDTEDKDLLLAVEKFGEGKWSKIAKSIGTKNAKQCLHRYKNKYTPGIMKGKWSSEEDTKLLEGIKMYGCKKWSKISEYVGSRNDPQCRERYTNILDPTLKRKKWTIREDKTLQSAVAHHGEGNWVVISKLLPGRTDSMCRRRFLHLKKSFGDHF